MQMAHRRSWNFPTSLSGNTYQQWHMDNLFTQTHWSVITPAVFEKFLAVIRGYSKHTIVPQMRLPKTVHQPRNLAVRPANACVVQPENLISFSLQAGRRQIRTVPVFVQIVSAPWLDVSACQSPISVMFRRVGSMIPSSEAREDGAN